MKAFVLIFMATLNLFATADEALITRKETPFPGSVLYTPNDGHSHPGIIFLHGSEGGSISNYRMEAEYLAAHGYSVLAFCWYNCRRSAVKDAYLPLKDIELRNSIRALQWLKEQPSVAGKIGLLGVSRGGEQAVLLGSFPEVGGLIDVVAVHTPSDIVEGSFFSSWNDKRCWICESGDLACFRGKDEFKDWDREHMKWNPACGPSSRISRDAWLLDGVPFKLGSIIEIEKLKKPVFITVGDKDDVWDYKKSVNLGNRLKAYGQPYELHVFPGEKHGFTIDAENKRHELLLKFLKSNLN